MWSTPTFDPHERPAENAVLEAGATWWSSTCGRPRARAGWRYAPGSHPSRRAGTDAATQAARAQARPGRAGYRTARVRLPPADEKRARPSWTAVSFDAWKHQRLDPPWWWLMSALDKRIRARSKRIGRWRWLRQRSQDVGWRLMRLAMDLLGVAGRPIGLPRLAAVEGDDDPGAGLADGRGRQHRRSGGLHHVDRQRAPPAPRGIPARHERAPAQLRPHGGPPAALLLPGPVRRHPDHRPHRQPRPMSRRLRRPDARGDPNAAA